MAKYQVTRQYSVNEVVEIEADSVGEAIDLVKMDEGKIVCEAEFRDWLEPSNWPVYNPETDTQEN
jgi:hypothetical protein